MRDSSKNFYNELIQALQAAFPGQTEVPGADIGAFRQQNPKFASLPSFFWQNNRTETRGVYSIENKLTGEKVEVSTHVQKQTIPVETDEEIGARIDQRFHVLNVMSQASSKGLNRSMIVSGPAGLGKSHSVEAAIESVPEELRVSVKGSVTATGLFRTLYEYRHSGCVIVFDDCDSVFNDMNALNFLKAACDSGDRRFISKLSEYEMFDTNGEEIPKSFEFFAAVIFITNLDFAEMIAKGNKMSPHFEALRSRSHYIDLSIKTSRDYLIRIKQVVFSSGMLNDLEEVDRKHIVSFIETNKDSLQELSLRMVKKLADLVRMAPDDWRDIAAVTCVR